MFKSGISITQIAKTLNVDRGSLSIRLKGQGVNVVQDCGRKYYINDDYFEIIDSERKAYWLGFIFADGNVSKNGHMLEIGLSIESEHHLGIFLRDTNSTYLISYRDVKIKDRIYPSCRVQISSRKICLDLIKYGCIANKSLTKCFPQNLPDEMLTFFIRGYFDGNGNIYLANNKKNVGLRIFSGSQQFCLGLQGKLIELFGIETKLYKDRSCYKIVCQKQIDVKKFLCFIYDKANVYLNAKYDKYQKCKAFIALLSGNI